jgi:hypothetical protein
MEPEIDQIPACGELWSVVERRTALLLGPKVSSGSTRVRRDVESGEGCSLLDVRERRGGVAVVCGCETRAVRTATPLWA